jgi:anti-anti-sigma regulatory factor
MINIKVQMATDDVNVNVSGEATIIHARELKDAMGHALSGCQSVTVCTDAATDVDLSCLQILCSAHRMARYLNRKLAVKNAALGALERAISNLGYSREAGCGDENDSCLFTGGAHE